ncbi:hypothetical protein L484_004157 [Morus notabilis]|uniref:Uncharacterized protein n=1 Tax=Morus notabilis TaxID=981085 RepID=W9QY20_9ROSA|nr:hypothetical protein L484_004157 [Morus notabilis]
MPKKRGKGKALSSGSSGLRLIDGKFVNEAAKAKFCKFMEKNKSIRVKRGLRPPEFDIEGDIANNIVQRNWQNLTDMQNPAIETVVPTGIINKTTMKFVCREIWYPSPRK